MEAEKSYRGYLTKFLLKKNNGWGLGLFSDEENPKLQVKIKGQIGAMSPHLLYEITGVMETSEKFGTSINVENYKIGTVNSQKATVKYLSSAFFPGIGVKTATLITTHYQDNVLDKIKADPNSLFLVPKVSQSQAQLILNQLKTISQLDLRPVFYENNLSLEIYDQVSRLVGSETNIKTVFQNQFFNFARLNHLQPFLEVDKIAVFFGLETQSAERIGYWAEKLSLNLAFNSGNTYSDLASLKKMLKKEIKIKEEKMLQAGLIYAKEKQLLYFVHQKVYCHEAWSDEEDIVVGLNELLKNKPSSRLPNKFKETLSEIETQVGQTSKQANFKYDHDQVEAFKTFLKNPVTLITGGPGTGKSTIITGLIALAQHYFSGFKIGVAAPTGRAAARLKEALNNSLPSTLHKMLEADEHGNFGINETYPLNFDLIIVDESSMVENHLFAQLMRSRGTKLKKLVLVGDANQLPPIGYGQIFDDLIASEKFGFCQLKKVHRQSQGNGIIDLAMAIQTNEVANLDWKKLKNVDVYFNESLQSNFNMLKLDYALNEKAIQASPFNYQIITPFYAGELGIESLNTFIQVTFNPKIKDQKLVYDRGRYRYTVGDKIMNLKNNPELDLTNGEVGVIESLEKLDDKKIQATAEFSREKTVVLDNLFFNDIALGYACSVHKTQGSEYANVAFVLEKTPHRFFLTKKLIYTAVTRAKNNLLIIGDYDLFLDACARESEPRRTTIQEKLRV